MTMHTAYEIVKWRWPNVAFARELNGVCSVGFIDWRARRYVYVGTGKTFAAAVAAAALPAALTPPKAKETEG